MIYAQLYQISTILHFFFYTIYLLCLFNFYSFIKFFLFRFASNDCFFFNLPLPAWGFYPTITLYHPTMWFFFLLFWFHLLCPAADSPRLFYTIASTKIMIIIIFVTWVFMWKRWNIIASVVVVVVVVVVVLCYGCGCRSFHCCCCCCNRHHHNHSVSVSPGFTSGLWRPPVRRQDKFPFSFRIAIVSSGYQWLWWVAARASSYMRMFSMFSKMLCIYSFLYRTPLLCISFLLVSTKSIAQ